jgi:hydroxymethylpyrimidine/phosphomethylpyrimidine kinase
MAPSTRSTAASDHSTPPIALTIAGSDSGGGAGIQADLATFAALGVHGTSVVTALTAQNTSTVAAVHIPPIEFLDAQLDAVLGDLRVVAVKTGMLANTAVVAAIAQRAAAGDLPNLVVDPVLVSSSGDPLFADAAEQIYIEKLFPHALIVTPNTREAAVLLGEPTETLTSVSDQRAAATALGRFGPAWVVVKGGHLTNGEAVDVVHETASGRTTELHAPWIDTTNNHGTGCTFAAAIAAHLARGDGATDAIAAAKAFVHDALRRSASWQLGAGHGPVAHTFAPT